MTLAGLIVALVLIGQIVFLVRGATSGNLITAGSTQSIPRTGTLSHRLDSVLTNALGAGDRGVQRFHVVRVTPLIGATHMSNVTVTWAINNNISAGTLGNGAQSDAYAVLRDIYTSGLHIGAVSLSGTYPMSGTRGRTRESVVMRLAMSRSRAEMVRKIGWDSFDAQTLWPLVDRLYIHPQFQPLSSSG
ncbi:MAG: hypothetical protein NVSMB52_00450 [Chloroflexota bacterium]